MKQSNDSKKTSRKRKSSCQVKKNSSCPKGRCDGKNDRNKAYRENRERFTTEEIVAWAEHHGGVSPKETQEKLNTSESTYYRYIRNIDEAVKRKIDVDQLRNVMLMLFSLALKSVIENLKAYNPNMTIAYLKGLGIFKEHVKGEGMGHDQYFMIGDEVINAFANKTLSAREKEISDPRSRLKKIRLSDPGDIVSGN